MVAPSDYIHIREHGTKYGWSEARIQAQQALAARDGVATTAKFFCAMDNDWRYINEEPNGK